MGLGASEVSSFAKASEDKEGSGHFEQSSQVNQQNYFLRNYQKTKICLDGLFLNGHFSQCSDSGGISSLSNHHFFGWGHDFSFDLLTLG